MTSVSSFFPVPDQCLPLVKQRARSGGCSPRSQPPGAEAELGEEGHTVGVALGRQMEAIQCQSLLINVVG